MKINYAYGTDCKSAPAGVMMGLQIPCSEVQIANLRQQEEFVAELFYINKSVQWFFKECQITNCLMNPTKSEEHNSTI